MKHTTFFYLVATAFVLVGATACSSGDDGDEPANPTPTNPTERKLVIGASANPWLDESGNARETRGAVLTTETLNGFSMHWNLDEFSYADYTVRRGSDGNWIPTPTNNDSQVDGAWPSVGNSAPISFYAHTAGTFNYNGGNRYISFSIEEASANQSDLLLSRVTNVTYSETKGVIWFTFDHACAAVEFNIQITNKLRTQLGTDLTVNSVVLKDIANTGDCYYSTGLGNHIGRWGNVSGNAHYTLTQADMKVGTSPVALPCKTLFIIPQTLGKFAGLEISYTFSDQTNTTAWISLQGTEWEAGYLYPINIVLGTTLIK